VIIRKLNREDKFQAGRISAICFHTRTEDLEEVRKKCEEDQTEEWGAFSEEGVIIARMKNIRFTSYLDGKKVANGGISGVSTLPEYRNTGAVRAIFEKLLPSAYENGEVLSTLTPFKHAFYRKFGYETVCFGSKYLLKPEFLRAYRFDGSVRMWNEEDPVEPYLALYEQFASRYSLAFSRDAEFMKKKHMHGNIYKDRSFSYMLSAAGRNIAYVQFDDVYMPEAALMRVNEAIYLGREGFEAVLGFLARFSADYGKIELSLPTSPELLSVIRTEDNYKIEKCTRQDYMVRLISVEKALTAIQKPQGTDVLLEVTDELIPQNSGLWHVTEKKTENIGAPGSGKADLSLSIQALSQLAVGAASLSEALLRPDVELKSKQQELNQLFPGKTIFVNEEF